MPEHSLASLIASSRASGDQARRYAPAALHPSGSASVVADGCGVGQGDDGRCSPPATAHRAHARDQSYRAHSSGERDVVRCSRGGGHGGGYGHWRVGMFAANPSLSIFLFCRICYPKA